MKYDYLVVGAGLYGAVFAREAKEKGKNVYWTPSDEIEKIPQKTEVTLKVYNNKTSDACFIFKDKNLFHK